MTFTVEEKRLEIIREIAMRRSVYGRSVANGRMSQEAADKKISIMQAILDDYNNTENEKA